MCIIQTLHTFFRLECGNQKKLLKHVFCCTEKDNCKSQIICLVAMHVLVNKPSATSASNPSMEIFESFKGFLKISC